MNSKMKVTNVALTETRGSVQLQMLDKDGKATTIMAIQFTDPKEAAKYEVGKSYTVTLTQTK